MKPNGKDQNMSTKPICPRTGGTHTTECPPRCRMPEDGAGMSEAERLRAQLVEMTSARDGLRAECGRLEEREAKALAERDVAEERVLRLRAALQWYATHSSCLDGHEAHVAKEALKSE